MASNALRLRRALSLSSPLLALSSATASSAAAACVSPVLRVPSSSPPPTYATSLPQIGSRSLHSTSLSLYASRSFYDGDDQIDENTILFEGCDYKHWLITMDFPKDPPPSPEDMVETYVQTLAKVVGSVEEAKKRMYACSTTTYTGFQAEIDEETSKKFEGMPGVVFVLPDSYVDPVNKEYGGDKYINGTIIPRPPPVQYGRQRRQRVPTRNPQGSPTCSQQGPMPGDGQNFMAQQNFPQQSYGPRQNFPSQQNYGPAHSYSSWDNHGQAQNYPPQQNYAPPLNNAPQQNYPPQQNYAPPLNNVPQQNYVPSRQGEKMDPRPTYNRDYSAGGRDGFQADGSGYPLRNQRDYAHSQRVYADNQNFPPSSSSGVQYGQVSPGSFGHNQIGHYEYGTNGSYGQGSNSAYGQGYASHGENRHFAGPQGEQNIAGQTEQRNYASTAQTGTHHGRY